HGAAVHGRGAALGLSRADRRERPPRVLPQADRVLRLRRARRRRARESDRRRGHELALGSVPRRAEPQGRHPREDLELAARRADHAGPPGGLPRHRARAKRALVALARVRGPDAGRGVRTATRPVPLSAPYLDEREEQAVVEVLRSGRLSLGPRIDEFEERFAERVGVPYAAAVSSGTAGLHLLCRIARVGPGDEVVTTPYSFAA